MKCTRSIGLGLALLALVFPAAGVAAPHSTSMPPGKAAGAATARQLNELRRAAEAVRTAGQKGDVNATLQAVQHLRDVWNSLSPSVRQQMERVQPDLGQRIATAASKLATATSAANSTPDNAMPPKSAATRSRTMKLSSASGN